MAINKVIYGGTTLIDLTGDTATASQILSGYKAHGNAGTQLTGTCTYDADTSDADAQVAEILATKTAYVNGSKLTGTMVNNGAVTATISDLTAYTIPIGYHDGSGTVAISSTETAKIIASNIKEGVEILGVTGTCSPASGVTAQSKTATPTTSSQVITPDANYDYLSQVTVAAIPYTETANAYGTTVTIG